MDAVTEFLAQYGCAITYENLPPEVIHKAKGLLLDSLACAMGGYAGESGKIARRIAEQVCNSDMHATIIGSGKKSSPDLAAFANGSMIRFLDLNDGFSSKGGGHPSDNFAPVIACGEAAHADGKKVIVASVLAYEVFCRLQDTIDLMAKNFDQAVSGVISCAVGVAKILGLTHAQMVQAINLAVAPNIVLLQSRRGEISMWKACILANAAKNAVFAALLAKEGMTGPSAIFEGNTGFFKAVSGPFRLENFGGDGRPYRMMAVSIKRHPCGKHAQTVVDAGIRLHSKISALGEIEKINIGTCAFGKLIMAGGPEKWHPRTRETADHSIPYVAGVALTYGKLEIKHFAEEYLRNQKLLDLIKKIRVEESAECNNLYPDASATHMEIITRSGEKFTEFVRYHRGHFQNPLNDEEINQKFHSLAGSLLATDRREELISLIWDLEKVEDIGRVMRLLKI